MNPQLNLLSTWFQASIQGPQGWDLVVNWIMERVKKTRKKSSKWRIMKSTSLFNNCRVEDDEDGETQEDDISRSRSMPMLPPRVMVESPSDPSPVTSRPRSRHSVMRPSSLRYKDIATYKNLKMFIEWVMMVWWIPGCCLCSTWGWRGPWERCRAVCLD